MSIRCLTPLALAAAFASVPCSPGCLASSDPGSEPSAWTFGAWQRQDTEPYRGKQDDIVFVTPDVGYYGNGKGRIYKTTDGGATWAKVLDKPGLFVRCLGFLDEDTGFAGNVGPGYFPGV